ncbi:MAG: hypothetical protein IJX78_03470 [Bacilli bacterium]|nr:hypothetical protein [Bacilli bacterium]
MAKNTNKKEKQNYIEKRTKADNTVEYVVHGSPSKTVWGKIVVGLIIAGTILIPVISLIIALLG